MEKIRVMLVLEGTYPFNGGGVSTWAHILCNRVQNSDFILYSLNAHFEKEPRYQLSKSVKEVVQLPLWTPDEPFDFTTYGDSYFQNIERKEATTPEIIEQKFVPLFKQLLAFIYAENQSMLQLDIIFYELWMYFKTYDYKVSMRSQATWDAYRESIATLSFDEHHPNASLRDLTIGMRWLYRFLLPISITTTPKADIAHITLSGFALLPALIANYQHGASIILTEHGVFIRERLLAINNSEYSFFLKNLLIKISESIAKLAYYKSVKILSVNKFNHKWEQIYGADPERLMVVYNGINHELFKPRPKPEHLREIPTVVALARIFELKDVLTMIRTCAHVAKEIPKVLFMVYGDDKAVPEYTRECLDLIGELQLAENFKLMGPRKNPHLLFPEGDISILTSISEGFPYTIIESMGCGVPVVSTDVGGTAEALDEHSGFICKPKDAVQLGDAVIKLLKDKALRESMGAHARQRVLENFTEDQFIASYEEIYQTVFESGRISIAHFNQKVRSS
jgi:glycosyltransferase involved in cell wall biosynthesis